MTKKVCVPTITDFPTGFFSFSEDTFWDPLKQLKRELSLCRNSLRIKYLNITEDIKIWCAVQSGLDIDSIFKFIEPPV